MHTVGFHVIHYCFHRAMLFKGRLCYGTSSVCLSVTLAYPDHIVFLVFFENIYKKTNLGSSLLGGKKAPIRSNGIMSKFYVEYRDARRVGHGLDSSMDWIGLDWVGLDWVQFFVKKFGLDWIGSEFLSAHCFSEDRSAFV